MRGSIIPVSHVELCGVVVEKSRRKVVVFWLIFGILVCGLFLRRVSRYKLWKVLNTLAHAVTYAAGNPRDLRVQVPFELHEIHKRPY
jgi:hypothetical protein